MGRKKKIPTVVEENINEDLKKPFLKPNTAKEESKLSTTREEDELYQNELLNSVMSFNSIWMDQEKKLAADDYIPNWRRLYFNNMEIQECVSEIVNEAVVTDSDVEILNVDIDRKTFKISKSISQKIVDEWKILYSRLNMDENLIQWFRQWYRDGVLIGEKIYNNVKPSEGVVRVDILDPIGMSKKLHPKTKVPVYVKKGKDKYGIGGGGAKQKYWLEEQIALANSGLYDSNLGIYISYLNYAMKPMNQLTAIETAIVIFALTRATDKLVYYVDVGNLPEPKAIAKIQQMARENNTAEKYDVATGRVTYNKDQIKLRKEIYLGTRNGEKGTRVESLSATTLNLNETPILEHFGDNVYRSMRVSKLRRKPDAMFNFGDNPQVEREEINFFKFICELRREFVKFIRNIFKDHLIRTKIIKAYEWDKVYRDAIKFKFNNNNDYAKMRETATLKSKIDLLNSMEMYIKSDANGEVKCFNLNYVLKEILGFTEDQIDQMMPEEDEPVDNVQGDGIDDPEMNGGPSQGYDPGDGSQQEDMSNLYNLEEKEKKNSIPLDQLESIIPTLTEGCELILSKSIKLVKQKNGDLVVEHTN